MTLPEDSASAKSSSPRRWIWFALKWGLFAAVMAFVGRRGWQLWQEQGIHAALHVKPVPLLLAALMYAVGWLPSVWFWRELMHRLGGDVGYRDAARAYYCGHLGKYVPGKAVVLVIRSALLKGRGTGAAAAAVTATVETLLMMGAGLAVAVALAPLLLTDNIMHGWPGWLRDYAVRPGITAAATIVGLLAVLPVLSRLLTSIAVRMTPRSFLEGPATVEIKPRLVAAGIAAFVVSWACHGLSLGFTIQAVSSGPMHLADWPFWTGAGAAATSIGFAAIFAPGGMGVREGLLIEFLRMRPEIDPQQAVAAALLLRIVWFVTEFGVAALLYFVFAPRREQLQSDNTR